MNEDIKVTFIIPSDCRDENDCSEEMLLAFTACEQHCGGGLHAQWVHEKQWKKFDGLNRKDVFVLTEFDGQLYEKLRRTKCLLVGPRCLSCCLTEGTPIPSGPEPVYTVAMRGLVITASGLNKQKKDNIKKKVQWMGGIYSTVLTDDTTHLISDTVVSDKYIKSVEKGIPIMDETWLEAVWEASLRLNVSAASSDFDLHRLKPFTNLQVTTSGISKKEKQDIMKLVNENGGEFSGAFQSETTDVVVLTKEGMGSEKYKAALEYGKACVLPAWVRESAARGVALPFARYRVAGAATSSPLAEHRLPDMSLDFSRITAVKPPSNFVDETKSDLSTMSGKMKLSQELKRSNDMSADDKEMIEELENFDMTLIKKAGHIFDGFCIWVSGLEGASRERAAALVSRCGGVRYDGPHARVTHAVVGARRGAGVAAGAGAAQRALPAVPVLRVRWLTDSVRAGRALDEAGYLVELNPATPVKAAARAPRPDAASPMSKRNLALLRHGPLDLPAPAPAPTPAPACEPAPAPAPHSQSPPQPHHDDDIVNHYLSQHLSQEQRAQSPQPRAADVSGRPEQPDLTDDMEDEPTEEVEQIFRDMKIEVQGLDEEAIVELGAEVSAAGGALVAAGAGGQYALVPLDFDPADLLTPAAEPVTVFWLKDCLSQQELLPPQYYHRPVCVGARAALRGVVASLSTYSGVERAYLDELAKLLGATTQLRFCRRNTANALASTHLICPTAAGDKYAGAVKWGLPAVRASWLLACAAAGRRVGERPHLVGDTTAPPSPEPQKTESALAAQDPEITTDESVGELKGLESAMPPPADACAPGKEHTPRGKAAADGEGEMSPASRYIAMARQGLLGGDSQDTPRRDRDLPAAAAAPAEGEAVRTPPLDDALSTPNLRGLSPRTRRRLQAVRRGEMPSDPVRTPTDPFLKNPPTPDSAFGGALRPGAGRMSPDARKRLWAVVHQLPGKQQAQRPREHTPLSEIRNRFLAQFHGDGAPPPAAATPPAGQAPTAVRKLHLQDEADTPPPKMAKLSENQCAGGATIDDFSDSSNSALHNSDGDADPSKSVSSASSALPAEVDAQLQRLNAALTGKAPLQRRRTLRESVSAAPVAESEPAPESQPNTVGWDDTTPTPAVTPAATPAVTPAAAPCATQTSPEKLDPTRLIKRFMLSSNVDNREEIIEMILYLGGEVCEGVELDPAATHLLCAAPGRSEKMLGSVAAGRWVLHPAYVARSRAAGAFLLEEQYEWGNPAAACLPAVSGGERALARAAHRWRAARAAGAPGPFAGVAALLHVPAPRRRLLARLVEAGGGRAPDIEPPYNDESVTVCFADVKRHPLSARDAAWLAARRVPVCAPVLLSAYLTDDVTPDPHQHCLPDYR